MHGVFSLFIEQSLLVAINTRHAALAMRNAKYAICCVYICKKAESMPKRKHSRSLARKGTSAAAAKRRRRQEDAQQRDSRLALARLVHYLASNLQVPL